MAFYKNPIIEEAPKCLVCGDVSIELVCSATCGDIWSLRASELVFDCE